MRTGMVGVVSSANVAGHYCTGNSWSISLMTFVRLLAIMVWAALLWPTVGSADDALLDSASLSQLGYFKYWDADLELASDATVSQAHLLDDNLYLVEQRGYVHAVHTGIGLPRWTQRVGEGVYDIYSPNHLVDADGRHLVIFSSSPRVVFLDAYQGDVVRDLLLDVVACGPAVATPTTMYFGSHDGHLYAMFWGDSRTKLPVRRWRVISGGQVTASPKLVNENHDLVFAANGGSVFSCSAEAKLFNWEFKANDAISGDLVSTEAATFVASADRSLYRIDTMSGVQRWRIRFPNPLRTGPVLTGKTLFQYSKDTGVSAVDAEAGSIVWSCTPARYYLTQTDHHVYFLSGDSRLIMADASSGNVVHSFPLPQDCLPVKNTVDSTLYLVCGSGRLLCAKPLGMPRLTPEEMSAALRGIHSPPVSRAGGSSGNDIELRSPDRDRVIDMNDPLKSPSKVPPLGVGSSED